MALHVLCPHCQIRYEVADEQAGRTAACPACGTVASIPSIGPSPPVPPSLAEQPGAFPQSPYASPQFAADPAVAADADLVQSYEMIAARFEIHRRLIGIFGIVVGVLSMLWAGLCGFTAIFILTGDFPNQPPMEQRELMAVMYRVFAVLGLITGLVQISAAIWLLCRKRGCRILGILAGFFSCLSVWGCLVWLLSLGYGVYSLVTLCGRDASIALGPRPAPQEGGPGPLAGFD